MIEGVEVPNPLSKDLLFQIVTTCPVGVSTGRLTFCAEGIKYLARESEGDEQRYIRECKEAGVTPFSRLSFDFPSNLERLQPEVENGWLKRLSSLVFTGETYRAETAYIDGVLGGKRTHQFDIAVRNNHGKRNVERLYGKFAEDVFSKLDNRGYQCLKGDFWFSAGLPLWADTRPMLFYDTQGQKGSLRLVPNEHLDKRLLKEVKDWFDSLAQNHSILV